MSSEKSSRSFTVHPLYIVNLLPARSGVTLRCVTQTWSGDVLVIFAKYIWSDSADLALGRAVFVREAVLMLSLVLYWCPTRA